MTAQQTLHIHLVSDSTGETVHQVARACVAQFPNVTTVEHVWTLVRSEAHLHAVCAGLDRNPGILLMSIVNDEMRDKILTECRSRGIPAVSVLDPVVHLLGRVLGQTTQNLPGGQRRLNMAYFDRIAAVDFAVSHDDGMNMGQLEQADILLVGVSRTSKTPTSMYLAHRGYKVANYALVPQVPFPLHYLDGLNLLVVGLTNDPKRLSQIRRTRQMAMADTDNVTYVDVDQITEEVRHGRRLFSEQNWPVIDVNRRSVEETAAAVIQLHTNWQESQA
ncbi:MAG: kinase/pyrophosphorylase [Alphaproteobacteria bacterium]|nr:kinase/pyrophosphorylase [Alphaproteobacteria bacterium]